MLPLMLNPRGLLGNAAMGYELAWAHRRQLLAVLVAALGPALTLWFVVDLVGGRDNAVIINGALVSGSADGLAAWTGLVVMAVGWLLALTAGALVVVGGLRETAVTPGNALGTALRKLPSLVVAAIAIGGIAVSLMWLVSSIASGVVWLSGLALFAGGIVAVALLVARSLWGVLTMVLGGSTLELTRGRVIVTAGAFLLGGVVVPVLLAASSDLLRSEGVWPIVLDVFGVVLLIGTVAVQASILAGVYLQRKEYGVSDEQAVVGLDLIGTRLEAMAGKPWRVRWIAAVALAVALLPAGAAAANLSGAPTLQLSADAPPGGALALAWPAGQHPVMVTNTGVRYCENDLCDRYVIENGGPAVSDGWGTASIGPDGTVIKGSMTGGEENGGPFIHYGACTRRDGCHQGWLPARASSDEPFTYSALALASAPDGAIWFALATPPGHDEPAKRTVEFKLIRCVDVKCAKPERHSLGTVSGQLDQGFETRQQGWLSIDDDGRPHAAFKVGQDYVTATCARVTCASPRVTTPHSNGVVELSVYAYDSQVESGDGTARLMPLPLPGVQVNVAKGSTAATSDGSRYYLTGAVVAAEPSRFRVIFGQKSQYWQQILWVCDPGGCKNPRRIPLDVYEGAPLPVKLVVSSVGQVLVVRADRISLLPDTNSD